MWFWLVFVDFYSTPYNTTKHNNNNGMRHETVWVDHTIDSTFHQNRLDSKRSNSSSYDWKERHQSHFPPPFCFVSLLLLLLFILLQAQATDPWIENESNRYCGTYGTITAGAAATINADDAIDAHDTIEADSAAVGVRDDDDDKMQQQQHTYGEGYRTIMIDKREEPIPWNGTIVVTATATTHSDEVTGWSNNNKLAQAGTGLPYENNNTNELNSYGQQQQQQQRQQTRTSNGTTRIE